MDRAVQGSAHMQSSLSIDWRENCWRVLLSLHAAAAREGTERETVSKKCRLGGFCLIGSVSTRSLHPPNKGRRRTETETDPAVCNVPARLLLSFSFFCYFYVTFLFL